MRTGAVFQSRGLERKRKARQREDSNPVVREARATEQAMAALHNATYGAGKTPSLARGYRKTCDGALVVSRRDQWFAWLRDGAEYRITSPATDPQYPGGFPAFMTATREVSRG